MTANVNGAMFYACERLKAIKDKKPDAQGMVLVYGVEENPNIQGKFSLGTDLSDPQTGESTDPEIFFKRNGKQYNQFNFFKNAAPFIKLFAAVVVPDGFGISAGFHDADGKPKNKPMEFSGQQFRCDKNSPQQCLAFRFWD